jgi:hypothetical protein
VCWSPDGKRLVTGSSDGMAKVWEAVSGRELLTLKGHTSPLSWSPDGKRLATASDGGMPKVWEAARMEAVQEWARQDRALEEILALHDFRGPQAQGFIQRWLLLLPLPFSASDEQALERQQVLDEAHIRPRPGARFQGSEKELIWREHRSPKGVVDFNAVAGRVAEQSVAYAVCYLASDQAREDLWLQVGSDDQAKVYLNGREIYQYPWGRGLVGLDTVGPLALKKGTNVLVFKVVNLGGNWEGCVRLVDEACRPAQGLTYKVTPEP